MSDSLGEPRRGPRPKPDPGTQTGYRVTARQRLELAIAQAFTGAPSMQAVLDQAVEQYLTRMKQTADGYQNAIDNAIAFQEKQAGVVSILGKEDDPPKR